MTVAWLTTFSKEKKALRKEVTDILTSNIF